MVEGLFTSIPGEGDLELAITGAVKFDDDILSSIDISAEKKC